MPRVSPKARFERWTRGMMLCPDRTPPSPSRIPSALLGQLLKAAFLAGAVARDEVIVIQPLIETQARRRALRKAAGKVWEGRG